MLSENGHAVTVFISDKTVDSLKIELLKEARVIRFNPLQAGTNDFLGHETTISYAFAQQVKFFIEKEGKPDIIESQDFNGIAYFLLQYKHCLFDWCKDVPVVITAHSPNFLYMEYNELPLYKQPNYWIGEMERFSLQAANLLISPSEYLVTELKKRLMLTNSNLQILPNPYKFGVLPDNASAVDMLNNSLTFYGKLSPQKGTFKILEKFQFLWDNGFDKKFTMVGGQDIVFHPLGETMGRIVRSRYKKYLRAGLLKLKDKIAPHERAAFFSESLIFIIPSIVDNLPYVVLELMSLGKIVIVSKQGGQAEIITDNKDGFIFDYEQSDNFEITLQKVLSLGKEERRAISENAIKKIEALYAYDKIYTQKIKLLKQLKNAPTISKRFPFIRQIAESGLKTEPGSGNELLSVVIPFFNLGEFIYQTVDSVLKSTYKPLEVIIINDGSTDSNSINALAKYTNHKQVRVVNNENIGLAGTRNLGAELAKGDYLAFLDADDTVESTYYEKGIRVLENYQNVHFVGAWTRYFGDSKNVWPTFNPEPPLILTHNTINSSSLIYKKAAFLQGGKNDPDFKIGLEDYESVIHLKSNGLNGVAIPEILFNYRVRKNSMIKKSTREVRGQYYIEIVKKHPSLFKAFHKEIEVLNGFKAPLTFDNATLDDFPFQHVPILNSAVRKAIKIVKANPTLKNAVLFLKKWLKK